MQHGFADIVNAEATQNLIAWIDRINARPAARKMFSEAKSEFAARQPAPAAA